MSTDAGASKCPVDHNSKSVWQGLASDLPEGHPPVLQALSSHLDADPSSSQSAPTSTASTSLSTTRVISSIPRASQDGSADSSNEKWVYPSEAQFFSAMARKNHNPQAMDMRTVVPIHNAVNERAWMHILEWEAGRGGDKCGGVKLVTFQGKPGQPSPRARWKSLLGYTPPFDRHDWIVDRCGTKVRYIIDFYTGRSNMAGNLAFYIDARPALDSWEGIRMRVGRFWSNVFGLNSPKPAAPNQASKPL